MRPAGPPSPEARTAGPRARQPLAPERRTQAAAGPDLAQDRLQPGLGGGGEEPVSLAFAVPQQEAGAVSLEAILVLAWPALRRWQRFEPLAQEAQVLRSQRTVLGLEQDARAAGLGAIPELRALPGPAGDELGVARRTRSPCQVGIARHQDGRIVASVDPNGPDADRLVLDQESEQPFADPVARLGPAPIEGFAQVLEPDRLVVAQEPAKEPGAAAHPVEFDEGRREPDP
jgi:hypothetical protein